METNKMSLKYEQLHTLPMRIYNISLIPTETLSVGPAKCLTLVMTFCLKKDDPPLHRLLQTKSISLGHLF